MSTENTSWGNVADWYRSHVGGDDTYHSKVVAPNLMRMVAPKEGKLILEIGCGEGYFARMFANERALVDGADIAAELIQHAEAQGGGVRYFTASADKLSFAQDGIYDVVVAVLTLQNMERIEPVMKEVARVLKPEGKFIFVLNHPAFRIPKKTAWGWDAAAKVQYRRADGYLTATKEKIDMTPGKREQKEYTYSFHRSLQDYMKGLAAAGFAISRIEEWISHRESEQGPRKEAEDMARKEFPLFLAAEAVRVHRK
ncbi:MAG: class I SAM-dependent methyltransferase [Candidatus Pacebacteria bacterium]|nr:class I SAM-dependent methyltransferase [Candidatus Paceibacterota bacterium]